MTELLWHEPMLTNRIQDINMKFASPQLSQKLIDQYFALYKWGLPFSAHDLTGTLPSPYIVSNEKPFTFPTPTSKSYEDICNERADELLAQDKPIMVAWSGGVDSTLAYLKLLERQRYNNQVTAIFNSLSITEYTRFYLKHLHHIPREIIYNLDVRSSMTPGVLYVTGELNDKLFVFETSKGGEYDLTNKITPETVPIEVLELLDPLMKIYPGPLNNVADLMIFLKTLVYWQHNSIRYYPGIPEGVTYEHFFNTNEFRNWAIFNETNRGITKYKDEAKKIILRLTGDEDYYLNKKKYPSLKLGWTFKFIVRDNGQLSAIDLQKLSPWLT